MDEESEVEIDPIVDEVDDTLLEVEDTEETTPEVEQPDVSKLQESNKKLYSRAKTAEAEAKAAKQKIAELEKASQQSSTNNTVTSDASVDEKILRSTKGYDDETIERLKVVSKGLGVDLFKAEADELFQNYLAKKQADEKKEKAKLGSSKGSQVTQERKLAELPREEHLEAFKEVMSKVN